MKLPDTHEPQSRPAPPARLHAAVADPRGRALRDLRISVTDRCNFRCTYCMPKEVFGKDFQFLERSQLLSFGEIHRMVRLFRDQGVEKIRITGGEPLVRRKLERLIEMLAYWDDLDLTLTTNGSLLKDKARDLHSAGLKRITVSLDSLDDTVFRAMNDVDFPVAQGARGHRGGRRSRPVPDKDQHGGQARRQRPRRRAHGALLQGPGTHPALHRVHGCRAPPTAGRWSTSCRRASWCRRSIATCPSSRSSPTTRARSPNAGATRTGAGRSASSPRSPRPSAVPVRARACRRKASSTPACSRPTAPTSAR